jgi:DNA-binding transcriptional ArsR family regulator
MNEIFKALADPGRRRLLDSLNAYNGQSLGDLCRELEMTRQAVSKHLAVLEAANLVTPVWHGREKLHYLNAEPINAIGERWIDNYDRERVQALADLKRALGSITMQKPEFVAERRSKVSFDIEPIGQGVKLTVVHDGFDPGSAMLESISKGWPLILASLKTLLETGESLSGESEVPRRQRAA